MKKVILGIIALIAIAVVALNMGGNKEPQTASTEAGHKDTLTLVTAVETSTLDPRMGNSAQNSIPIGFIYDTLVRIDRDTNEVIPVLAESWEFVDDTHLKIKLREGVLFSDGSPLTAEDVFFSLKRTKEHSTSISTMKWLDIENSKIVDDHTLILAMYEPYSPVFYALSDGSGRAYIGSKKAMESMGEDAYARMPVGTGPYKLVDWKSGTSMHFVRNEHYWGEKPLTENLVLNIVPEPSGRVIELETGNADVAFYIEASDIERVKNLKGFHIEQGDTERYFVITLSMQEPLFQDKRVREALALAIDKESLVNTVFEGAGKVLNGYYSPVVFGYKDFGPSEHDIDKAKKLLAEAGHPNGLKFELHVQPTSEFQRIAEVVQAMWAQIGVQAEIISSELATYEAQKGGKFQAAIRDGNAQEVSNILIIYESSFGSRLQGNDKKLDEMLAKVKATYDKDAKEKLLHEVQDYLHEIRFSIPFATVPAIYGVSDKLEGFKFDIPYKLRVSEWSVKQ